MYIKKLRLGLVVILLILIVTACPETEKTGSFSLAVVGRLTITKGQVGLANIAIARTSGFGDLITFSLEGQPQGVSASFEPVSTRQNASRLRLTISNRARAGKYNLKINGNSSDASADAYLELIIKDPGEEADFSLTISNVKIEQGSIKKTAVRINRTNGFDKAVDLSISHMPPGVTVEYNPSPAINSSELTFQANAEVEAKQYALTLVGRAAGKVRTSDFILTVEPTKQADFSISVNATKVKRGASAKTVVTITRMAGFNDLVALSLSGEPNGVSGQFNPQQANNSSELTLTAGNDAVPGDYTLTVTAVSGGKTRTSDFVLKVEPKEDNQKPAAIAVTPAGGEIGVEKTANIVITFSEAMDRAKTEAAYKSDSVGLKANEVSFSWNQAGTVLTINPNNDLKYKAINDLSELGFEYSFELTNDATDLAGNNLVNTLAPKFRTLRNMTHIIYAEKDAAILKDISVGACLGDNDQSSSSICIGDGGKVEYDGIAPMGGQVDVTNKPLRGFFSFSISELPDNIKEIKRATFYANQKRTNSGPNNNAYRDLHTPGRYLRIEHVFFGPILRVESFDTPVLHDIGNLSTSPSLGYKAAIVTESLKEDYNLGVNRLNKSQYRLRFEKDTDNDGWIDLVEFYTKEGLASKRPKLVVNYLVP